ncbi:FAD-binding domain-containing protein [Aquirufa nivalisilvae]|uniref:FAD-binding domain-containing protein n=1 Tax=Aquirufa nivalisilvae TaxID=2516557 RepID=UPI0022A9F30D|nr:FAD-binding domain-containing protein [Aquirufa nivalisilvae]MCZ2479164.1 deoxyribodipyrimidine photolyase [Aquirufa nivalisilvae]
MIDFPRSLAAVHHRIDTFDPIHYARTRNFIDGGVSYLSPYLSRGFITITEIYRRLKNRGFSFSELDKFIQELAWREYYTKTWFRLGDGIFQDIRHPQEGVLHYGIPAALVHAQTGIQAVDSELAYFAQSGYLHNHIRMYIASLTCNVAHYHWSAPATWMYYHLLDGDLASNALSWQWCAATFSNKPYYANQENVNHFTRSEQRNTVIDCSYEDLPQLPVPDILKNGVDFKPQMPHIPFQIPHINTALPTFVIPIIPLIPIFIRGRRGIGFWSWSLLISGVFLCHPIRYNLSWIWLPRFQTYRFIMENMQIWVSREYLETILSMLIFEGKGKLILF